MRPSPSSKLIRFLEEKIGEKVSYKELKHKFINQAAHTHSKRQAKGQVSRSAFQRTRSASKRRYSSQLLSIEELENSLDGLAEFKLIEKDKKFIRPIKAFHVSGRFSISPRKIGYVDLIGLPKNSNGVLIPQSEQNGALTGDQVLVKIIDYYQGRFGGHVVKILQRARSTYRIRLLAPPSANKRNKFIPAHILDISPANLQAGLALSSIPLETAKKLRPNDVVIASLDGQEVRYERGYCYRAQFTRREEDTDQDLDLERILMKYDLKLSYPNFNEKLPEHKEIQRENTSDWKKRKDLRSLYTITIDGENSKDFDDALSLSMLSQDQALLYVHIADVSYYVSPNSPLDLESQKRGTSYYLTNRVIPMLPPQLSENLCSLVAHQNRLSLTAEMKIDLKTGMIQKANFYRSIIRVDRRLNYGEAEEKIEHPQKASPFEALLKKRQHLILPILFLSLFF